MFKGKIQRNRLKAYAVERKAICNMHNMYQCYVMTHYIVYIKYTSICRSRYNLVDSKGDDKTTSWKSAH